MIVDQEVEIKWHNRSKKHYESLGYVFTRVGEVFKVRTEQLQLGSEVEIRFKCDYCGSLGKKTYKDLMKSRKIISKDCCKSLTCMSSKRKDAKVIPLDSRLDIKSPEVAKEWNYRRNSKRPQEYPYNSGELVWWVCRKGHEWRAYIRSRTRLGRGCHYCAGRAVNEDNCLAKQRPEILKEWDYNKNIRITPFNTTAKSGKKVWWRCGEGHSWEALVSNRVNGSGCPVCLESRGEKRVREWLETAGIVFEQEYSFDGLVGLSGGLLRYDFAVFSEEGNLEILLEYDGEFHFKKQFEGDGHEIIKLHDQIKYEYCCNHSIPLIRIPYTDYDNVESILIDKVYPIIEGRCRLASEA